MTNTITRNNGVYTANDLVGRRVEVKFADMMVASDPDLTSSIGRHPSLRGQVKELALYDGDLKNLLAFARLSQSNRDGWLGTGYVGKTLDHGLGPEWEEGHGITYNIPMQ